ncbi:RodZ family helix-turn-helix domain-containing protein [Mechercharimyces sp. CAU 1602]|uniref:helix-turn-helix domain-containing protein n=1 Tax=Mechercharimyces sp. CAU 1602 TaxID=2973933 RepID=UPI002163C88F|nr:helix-turn-helix transcriptional regulator [Mechercharimyces sp. CAU 1602]MCS1351239.1 helix-turn-helix domain-containing protein [Mechercharimyces sp. CAU 1602]
MSDEIGLRLRRAREAMGLSVEELAEQTRIQPSELMIIEEGRFEELPSPFYARSYLRSYANAVGVEPQTVLRQYRVSEQQRIRGESEPPLAGNSRAGRVKRNQRRMDPGSRPAVPEEKQVIQEEKRTESPSSPLVEGRSRTQARSNRIVSDELNQTPPKREQEESTAASSTRRMEPVTPKDEIPSRKEKEAVPQSTMNTRRVQMPTDLPRPEEVGLPSRSRKDDQEKQEDLSLRSRIEKEQTPSQQLSRGRAEVAASKEEPTKQDEEPLPQTLSRTAKQRAISEGDRRTRAGGGSSTAESLMLMENPQKKKKSSWFESTFNRILLIGILLLIPAAIFVGLQLLGDDSKKSPEADSAAEASDEKSDEKEGSTPQEESGTKGVLTKVSSGEGEPDVYELSGTDNIEVVVETESAVWIQIREFEELVNRAGILADKKVGSNDKEVFTFDNDEIWIEFGNTSGLKEVKVGGVPVELSSSEPNKKLNIKHLK